MGSRGGGSSYNPPFWKRGGGGRLEHDIYFGWYVKQNKTGVKTFFSTPKIKILLSGPISQLFMTGWESHIYLQLELHGITMG